jgi:Tfp pilus assembly protein FimT
MLPTGLSLADFELRVGLAILAIVLVLAGVAFVRRQFGQRSTSKHPRR